MSAIRQAYLEAATAAEALLRDDAVVAAWSKPSALTGFTVGGLAAHLLGQLTYPVRALAAPAPDGTPIPVLEHYQRVAWIGADLDADANVAIVAGGEREAEAGPAEIARAAADALASLTETLPTVAEDRRVAPPSGGWALWLDDHLLTRMMEIVVHSDDLAVSVGIETPELPPSVVEPVVDLLTRIALRRRGSVAVVRALSRAERAPETISAF
jgi:hypothetical protein